MVYNFKVQDFFFAIDFYEVVVYAFWAIPGDTILSFSLQQQEVVLEQTLYLYSRIPIMRHIKHCYTLFEIFQNSLLKIIMPCFLSEQGLGDCAKTIMKESGPKGFVKVSTGFPA